MDASGHIAVARLSQGISPKHCTSDPLAGLRAFGTFGEISNLLNLSSLQRRCTSGPSTAAR